MISIEESKRAKKAGEYFLEGYNCSQSLVLAFSDYIDMDQKMLLRTISSFGGGMGRLREVCGSVSGMFFVLGHLYGYDDPKDVDGKKELYERVQYVAEQFRKENGSIVCRELLGLSVQKEAPTPSERTGEYYKKRPCKELIMKSAVTLEEYIKGHPVK